jgi:hypothetical protein
VAGGHFAAAAVSTACRSTTPCLIAVVELSQSRWLVGGIVPGIERQPCKKLEPSPERLLAMLHRWRDEAVRAGRTITRIALAFEAGRDGFWLARWLEARAAALRRKCCDKGPILAWGSASARGMETARQHGYIPSEDRDRGANPSLRS